MTDGLRRACGWRRSLAIARLSRQLQEKTIDECERQTLEMKIDRRRAHRLPGTVGSRGRR
jgi:hypothetical protein